MIRVSLALLLVALTGPAIAGSLAVAPPAPFTFEAAEIAMDSLYTEQFGIIAPEGVPQPVVGKYLCTVGYFPAMGSETQDKLNAEMLDPGFIAGLTANLRNGMTNVEQSTETIGGVVRLEFIGTPEANPDFRFYMAMWQTPAGNVQESCSTNAGSIDAALPLFRAIRDTVAPPGDKT